MIVKNGNVKCRNMLISVCTSLSVVDEAGDF